MKYAFFSNPEDGTKFLACPHCGRILEVDIDDALPVHSPEMRIHISDTGKTESPDPVDGLCQGSWNVTGVFIQIWIGESPWKKRPNNDAD